MRRELKKRGVRKRERWSIPRNSSDTSDRRYGDQLPDALYLPAWEQHISARSVRDIPGSVAFVPSVAGLIIAGEVVKDLCR